MSSKASKSLYSPYFNKKISDRKTQKNPWFPKGFWTNGMETIGLEPTTFWLPAKRSPSWAKPPCVSIKSITIAVHFFNIKLDRLQKNSPCRLDKESFGRYLFKSRIKSACRSSSACCSKISTFLYVRAEIRILISYKTNNGTEIIKCEVTSGGEINAATTNNAK